MIPASVVLITQNEEKTLADTLHSVKEFAEIIVVDSQSKDRTREVARQMKAKVFVRPFDNFANQKNFAVGKAEHDWVLSLDADERPDPLLMDGIRKGMSRDSGPLDGYAIRRRNFHFGRELRWGGQGDDWPVRFFRKSKGKLVNSVHEKVVVQGRTGRLPGFLLHESTKSVGDYLKKFSLYTGLEAESLRQKGRRPSAWDWGIKPFLRFLYVYLFRLGFLDGFEGFLFHSLSSFYLVIKQARLAEFSVK